VSPGVSCVTTPFGGTYMSEELLCCKKGWCDEPIEDPGKTGTGTPGSLTNEYVTPPVVTISYGENV